MAERCGDGTLHQTPTHTRADTPYTSLPDRNHGVRRGKGGGQVAQSGPRTVPVANGAQADGPGRSYFERRLLVDHGGCQSAQGAHCAGGDEVPGDGLRERELCDLRVPRQRGVYSIKGAVEKAIIARIDLQNQSLDRDARRLAGRAIKNGKETMTAIVKAKIQKVVGSVATLEQQEVTVNSIKLFEGEGQSTRQVKVDATINASITDQMTQSW